MIWFAPLAARLSERIGIENTAAMPAISPHGLEDERMERMTNEQFQRESDYRVAMSIMRTLLNRGLITTEDFKKAKARLLKIYDPLWGHFPDVRGL